MTRATLSTLSLLLISALSLAGCNASSGVGSSADTGHADVGGSDVSDVSPDAVTDIEEDISTALPEPDNHRPEEIACDRERPATEFLPDPDSPEASCYEDADCMDGDNGRCTNMRFGWQCTYDLCFTDDDCGGSVCSCGGGFGGDHNVCLSGACNTDSDCATGSWCSPSFGDCGDYSGVVAYYCRTPEDACLNDSDCTDEFGGYCMYSDTVGHWSCSYSQCVGK